MDEWLENSLQIHSCAYLGTIHSPVFWKRRKIPAFEISNCFKRVFLTVKASAFILLFTIIRFFFCICYCIKSPFLLGTFASVSANFPSFFFRIRVLLRNICPFIMYLVSRALPNFPYNLYFDPFATYTSEGMVYYCTFPSTLHNAF